MSQDLFLIAALAILIAFMFSSSRKRKKQAEALLASVKVGSSVVLHSGITGKVTSLTEDRVVIETTPGTKIAMLKGAIRSVDVAVESKTSKSATSSSTSASQTAKKPAAKKPVAKKPTAK
jgi:preprotein translocase subunit YajC